MTWRHASALALALLTTTTTAADRPPCFAYRGAVLDTSANGDASPLVRRAIGLAIVDLAGTEHLVASVGNELELYSLGNPLAPRLVGASSFGMGVFGDRDQNLFGFTVEPGGLGVATYDVLGSVVFELGLGGAFTAFHAQPYPEGRARAALAFRGPPGAPARLLLSDGLPQPTGARLYNALGREPDELLELSPPILVPGFGGTDVTSRLAAAAQLGPAVYLATASNPRQLVVLDVTTPEAPRTAHTLAGTAAGPYPLAVAQGRLVVARGGAAELYALDAPLAPALSGVVVAPEPVAMVGLAPGLVWLAASTTSWAATYDDDLAELSPGYWTNTDLVHNSAPGLANANAVGDAAGSAVYVARFTQLQVHERLACDTPAPPGDQDGDGQVDARDLALLIQARQAAAVHPTIGLIFGGLDRF